MWLLAAVILIFVTGLAIFWPYLRPQALASPGSTVTVDPRLTDLYDQRDMLYRAVRDARLDLETGKLSEADFEQHEAGLKQQAADVLRSIDQVEQELFSPQLDAQLEAEISAVRGASSVGTPRGADDMALEASIAAARRSNRGSATPPATSQAAQGNGQMAQGNGHGRPVTSASIGATADRYCGHCGGPLQVGDRFCGKCGQAVRAS